MIIIKLNIIYHSFTNRSRSFHVTFSLTCELNHHHQNYQQFFLPLISPFYYWLSLTPLVLLWLGQPFCFSIAEEFAKTKLMRYYFNLLTLCWGDQYSFMIIIIEFRDLLDMGMELVNRFSSCWIPKTDCSILHSNNYFLSLRNPNYTSRVLFTLKHSYLFSEFLFPFLINIEYS